MWAEVEGDPSPLLGSYDLQSDAAPAYQFFTEDAVTHHLAISRVSGEGLLEGMFLDGLCLDLPLLSV